MDASPARPHPRHAMERYYVKRPTGKVFGPFDQNAIRLMLKGNKLTRRGRPIRQVAIVVEGTVKLVTSGDRVDRRTYDALIESGVLPPRHREPEAAPAPVEALPDPLEDA